MIHNSPRLRSTVAIFYLQLFLIHIWEAVKNDTIHWITNTSLIGHPTWFVKTDDLARVSGFMR